MTRAGVVLGGYLATVHRFVTQRGETNDTDRLCTSGRAVLTGDGLALIAFLHAARTYLTVHQAPEEVWRWHEAALTVVIDLVIDGATFQRLDEDLRQGLVTTYHAASGRGPECGDSADLACR
ncbi:hypothetical protein [Streptoalloteichus hindustanus]|nr:hypothetical protein [Streptoalloteichus hindustanus]